MQTELPRQYTDWIYTNTGYFNCKILNVTNNTIIYLYRGCKQGMALHRVQYFRYGEA